MNDKKPPLDAKSVSRANNISLQRQNHKGSILLVEGDTDSRLFEKLLDNEKCKIEAIGPKDDVLQVVKILEERENLSGFFAIVDADFEHIEGYEVVSPNLLRTETYNIESLLLKSETLENLLREDTNREKLAKFKNRFDIKEKLLEGSLPISGLRLINFRKGWSLKFNGLRYGNFVDSDTLDIEINDLINTIYSNSPEFIKKHADLTLITEEYSKLDISKIDPWLVCNGHDMMEILLFGYQNIWGMYKKFHHKGLESDLRKCYELRFFEKTELYNEILEWEKNNQPYFVLKEKEE